MIPLHYKGYVIRLARQSGGKAGRGHNKTTSLQICEGPIIKKQISYKKHDDDEFQIAVAKARIWIDNKTSAPPDEPRTP